MAPSSRVEFELEVADDHLVTRLEAGPLERRDHPDLSKTAFQVVEGLRVLEVVAGHQELDAPAGNAKATVALRHHVEALLRSRAIDAVLGFEAIVPRRDRGDLIGQRREDRLSQLV